MQAVGASARASECRGDAVVHGWVDGESCDLVLVLVCHELVEQRATASVSSFEPSAAARSVAATVWTKST